MQHGPSYCFSVLRASLFGVVNSLRGIKDDKNQQADSFICLPVQISTLQKSLSECSILLGIINEVTEEIRRILTSPNGPGGESEKLSNLTRCVCVRVYVCLEARRDEAVKC